MKAIILQEAGGVENLHLAETETPTIKANEVLVETKALSINPVDWKMRAIPEVIDMLYGEERPVILGWDIAGIVSEVGENVSKFQKGDRVFGMVNFPGAGKAYAESVASPEDHLAKIPENTNFEDAAASTLAALTALQSLKTGKVKSGDKVLIHAGSGGVGHFAIQIAKNMGAYVVATSSAKNKDFVMSLGADEHIDYRTQDFAEILSDMDFVLDPMNAETLEKSISVTKNDGNVVFLPDPQTVEALKPKADEKNIALTWVLVKSDGADMQTLADMLEAGTLKAHVSKTFDFENMADAHKAVETGRTVGKVIVKV